MNQNSTLTIKPGQMNKNPLKSVSLKDQTNYFYSNNDMPHLIIK